MAPFVPLPKLKETQELEAWLQQMYADAAKTRFSSEVCAAAIASYTSSRPE